MTEELKDVLVLVRELDEALDDLAEGPEGMSSYPRRRVAEKLESLYQAAQSLNEADSATFLGTLGLAAQ